MVDQSFKLLMTKVGVFQLQFQSLQIDDSSIGVGNLRTILKLTFANREIVAVISGGIMRMNGLWLRFMFRLTCTFPHFESAYGIFEICQFHARIARIAR